MLVLSTVRPLARQASSLHRVTLIQALRYQSTAAASSYKNILVESVGANKDVSLITLNRPKALNALNSELFHELNDAMEACDKDEGIGAIVLTGSEKAFAAGADIKEMKDKEFAEVYKTQFLGHWTKMNSIKKPIIGAVSGYALGGGCELAMMCDVLLATSNATFGQPEINLGVIPGSGGTQRLTHAIGKSRAMEIVLSGRNFSAKEAEQWGLVSRIVGDSHQGTVDEAVKVAEKITSKGRVSVQAAKEAVNAAFELPLSAGLTFERRLFHMLFATSDQKEGMGAFAEKRKAKFTHK